MSLSSSTQRWAPALAVGVPLLAYAWSTPAYPYWLDSGELTAASVWLDIAHPPGHPLACLWGKLFALVPLGPLPFRVAMSQAVAAALALLGTYHAIVRTFARVGSADAACDAAIATGATWLLAGTGAFFFQAVRAEVYATQAMLICFAMAETARLATRDAADDARPLLRAALALGLGLANHHFMAVLALPMLAWELARLTRGVGVRTWGLGALVGLLGLSTYVYLPLRALTEPPLDLGHPATFASFWWVVSGRLYAHHTGSAATQPLAERLADLSVLLVEQAGIVALVLALLGLYTLARVRAARGLAYAWAAAALASFVARAWLGPVRANPDVLGYLMPGFAAIAVLAATGFAALLGAARALPGTVRAAVAVLPLGLGVVSLAQGSAQHGMRDFRATEAFDARREVDLPPRALVVTTTPTLAFHHWSADAVEHARPDLTMLPLTFLHYPHAAERASARTPVFAELVRSMRGDALPLAPLLRLAETQPVWVELDAHVALPVIAHLLPDGLLYRVLPRPPSRAEVVRAATRRERDLEALARALRPDLHDQETARQLLFLRYVDALYLAHHGARDAALRAVQQGLAIYPETRELHALRAALARVGEGVSLDVAPFLAGAASKATK
ncbi:MAG: DUF2723 domain-containing protein [Polyangiales bacterium]